MADGVKAESPGLREVTRRAVKAEIASKALALFLAQGFEETTVSQIAAEVGTSTRNVFRYFASKEDMLFEEMIELGGDVAEALARRPSEEDAWTALRAAVQVCVDSMEADPLGLRRAQLLLATPSLRPAMLDKQLRWQELLVPHTIRRLRAPEQDRELRARALVSAALSCLDVGAVEWTRRDGMGPLGALVDTTFASVRQ
ncbi:TetR/AcrR family transcriptional regulator [Catenulispora rubra]|uniref:TetR/AcrR family transcriptional regulator n=1 Tax=Catenulispora rubra TaxID=280293 RepID=UPI00189214D3|nr:TetR/AcrR family transcriptional regulator [Catenulispora rubra]